MRQTSFADMSCSLARSLEVIGDWWTPLILRDVFLGIDKFDDLVTDLGISRPLLSARLETLVSGGILERELYNEHPQRFRFRLTAAGYELVPVLVALTQWGDRWRSPDGAPMQFRHSCGEVFTAELHCSACGDALDAHELTVEPGIAGRVGHGTMLMGRVFGVAS
jgi:DNA-binding HxlR family transcriptional regulator